MGRKPFSPRLETRFRRFNGIVDEISGRFDPLTQEHLRAAAFGIVKLNLSKNPLEQAIIAQETKVHIEVLKESSDPKVHTALELVNEFGKRTFASVIKREGRPRGRGIERR